MTITGTAILTRARCAGEAIAPRRIVTLDAEGNPVQATGPDDVLIGASTLGGEPGDIVDVVLAGLPVLEFGDAVAPGDALTADEQGRAVPVGPEGGRAIGFAWEGGVAGDLGHVLLSPHTVTG